MDSLSKLTLKGYFNQLKSEVEHQAGIRKEDIKATGYKSLQEESTHKLLELLIKAVALVEEIHQNDAEFLQEDHLEDYQAMIATLHEHGINYSGNTEILEMQASPAPSLGRKKPMQKAQSKSRKNQKNTGKKAG